MTTPAQSINTLEQVSCPTRQRSIPPSGLPGPWAVGPVRKSYVKADRNVRPVSVNSPIRSDGTRAPRDWDRQWGHLVSPVRTVSYIQKNSSGPNSTEIEISGYPLITLGNGISGWLSQVGGDWARGPVGGAFPYDAESIARTRFLNKLLDQKADWGVTLGEMSETVSGIRKVSSDIVDTIDWLADRTRRTKRAVVETILGIPPRKKRGRSSRQRLDSADRLITDQWLQFQFSVAPTLSDIHTSAEALSWLLFEEKKPLRMKFRAGSKVQTRSSYSITNGYVPGWYGNGPASVETECHLSCFYDIVPTTQSTFAQLGLTNPASVAWELTQLSWMVDYLTTTGEWINSMTKNDSSTFVEGSITRVMRVKPVGPLTWTLHSRISSIRGASGALLQGEAGRMQRVVLQNVHPAIRPAFRNRMNITRMANVLAVLSKLVR